VIGGTKRDGIAAFFDLDGTLVPTPSLERRFFSVLRKDGKIPLTNYLSWSVETLRSFPKGLLAVQHSNKKYLRGVWRDLVFRHMETITFFEEGITRMAWHAKQGHKIFLVSGTLDAIAQLAATGLECELEARGVQVRPRVCATRLLEVNGRWTGDIDGEALYGRAKAACMKAVAAERKIDLRQCHAYGNSLLDRHFLNSAGYGHAVNPCKEMAALAMQKNWMVWHWHEQKPAAARGSKCMTQGIQRNEGAA
jgi:HAD superfamily phosphoserine phosphatase-like hydrolase